MTKTTESDNSSPVQLLPEKRKSAKEKLLSLSPDPADLPIFKNWYETKGHDNRPVKNALSQNALCDHFLKLMPECITVNDMLHLVRDYTIKPVTTAKKLAVAVRKKDILLDFQQKLTYGLPFDEFYEAITQETPQYTVATKYPRWPRLKEHYVIKDIPANRNGKLDELVDQFSYSRPVDRDFLKALFISPAWSNGWGQRPLFVIGGENKEFDDDHGTGKSTIMMLLERIYGRAATIPDGLSRDRMIATFQSIKNQNRLLVKLDNIRGTFENTALEAYMTDEWIGGYKLGEGASEIRNEFTFILTANSPHFNKDGAYRSVLIKLKKPKVPDPDWKKRVTQWIEDNFDALIQDIGSYLEAPRVPGVKISPGVVRWSFWIETILNKCNPEAHKAMDEGQNELQASEDHIIFGDKFRSVTTYYYHSQDSRVKLDPETDSIFITNDLIFDVYREAFNDFKAKRHSSVFAKIKTLSLMIGLRKTKMPIRIDGLGNQKGYILNFDPSNKLKPVFILIKHYKSGQDFVFHQPTQDFIAYIE
jgi:hypothetical protein